MFTKKNTLLISGLCFYLLGFVIFQSVLPHPTEENIHKHNIENNGLAVFTGDADRISHTLEIIRNGFQGKTLISGVNKAVKPYMLIGSLSELQQSQVNFDYKSETTRDNVTVTREWASTNQLNKITIITSYYHLPRSKTLWKQHNPENKNDKKFIKVEFLPVFTKNIGIQAMFREYNKLLLTFVHIL